ncbi:MAG: hypothetical protein IJ229_06935 [Clostridia bacterium]|nr:hypothetical protein [Clostridia bacterium]
MRILCVLCTFLCALLFFTFSCACAESDYSQILDSYLQAMQGDDELLETDDAILTAYHLALYADLDPLEATGYALCDMNLDGTPELIIGEAGEVQPLGGCIFAVYTIVDGEIHKVLEGWERYRVYLTLEANGMRGYYAEGSSGASNEVVSHAGVLRDLDWADAVELENNVDASYVSSWTMNAIPISEENALEQIRTWQALISPLILKPLSAAYPFRFTDEQTPDLSGGYACSLMLSPASSVLDLTVTDTGMRDEHAFRENVLCMTVTSRDGILSQSWTYAASVLPTQEPLLPFLVEDVNLDGYTDLLPVTAQGASNLFTIVCLWNPEKACFDPPLTAKAWDEETLSIPEEESLLELCNYQVDKGSGLLLSDMHDGAASHTLSVYAPSGNTSLYLTGVLYVDTGSDGTVHEMLLTEGFTGWDLRFPEHWYYGDPATATSRQEGAIRLLSGTYTDMQVTNTDWVHLRSQSSKASASLAHLDKGQTVHVLRENCADGWSLVYVPDVCLYGYIWHSFLK